MSERLKNDVLFVSVDGFYDVIDPAYGYSINSHHRIDKVVEYKNILKENGYRVKLLNPLDFSDIKIPAFPYSISPKDSSYIDELDYSIFVAKYLYDYIKTESFTHIILFQYDGFVNNFDMWDDDFLNYDFLGSSNESDITINKDNFYSLKQKRKGCHLNGGFSLRSKEFIERYSNISYSDITEMYNWSGCNNEDLIILDYVDWKKMPKDKSIINKFVGFQKNKKSFGFHKN
jgi:hypothetical protein